MSGSAAHFEVAKITQRILTPKGTYYEVRWNGDHASSWEPESHLIDNCKNMLQEFLQKEPEKIEKESNFLTSNSTIKSNSRRFQSPSSTTTTAATNIDEEDEGENNTSRENEDESKSDSEPEDEECDIYRDNQIFVVERVLDMKRTSIMNEIKLKNNNNNNMISLYILIKFKLN